MLLLMLSAVMLVYLGSSRDYDTDPMISARREVLRVIIIEDCYYLIIQLRP